jgi:beta-glucosidase
MDMNMANERSDALLLMWYPGMEGGSALADILWGDYNPSGKLPISIPRSVGQIPVYYSQPVTGDYVEESAKPLFPFGYGLSYTQFEYSDMEIKEDEVSVTVTNVGAYNGDEVVQLYYSDKVSSLALSSKSLVGFQRIYLKSGESKRVSLYCSSRLNPSGCFAFTSL